MNIEPSDISDTEFIRQLEQLQLAPKHFNHLGHLRLTWLYLQHFPADIASAKVCQTISNYARYLNAPQKFHLTVTCTLVQIIAQRMQRSHHDNWRAFYCDNKDLLENTIELVQQCFSIDIFELEIARTQLIEADLYTFQ
ncbi:hypothetical protein A9R01_01635 ['Osedax' symbiont bacterium Rs2_46_30_T18]|nr:hypothetical protein A9R01_01635 ['Osedax' symbiont bacterium Rs2_46_30_T18]